MAPINNADREHRMGAAIKAYEVGRLDDAKAIACQILASDPNASAALHLLGAVAVQQGNLPEAATWFTKAMQGTPVLVDSKLQLAEVLGEMGQSHRARTLLMAINSDDPAYFDAQLHLGKLLQRSGAHEAAAACLKKALANDRTSAEGHHRLGYSLEMLGQLDRALYHYQRSLSDTVDDHRVLTDLGNVYRKLGRLEAAEKAYRKALSTAPDDAEILNCLAVVYRLGNRLETALDTCRQSLSIAPDSAHAHHNAGIIQRQLSNHQAAERCYRKAIDLDPLLAAAHYNLGELYRDQGHFASALESYRKAIDLQPDFYQAFNGMGDAHRLQGNRRAAMDAYQSAIKVNPKCVKSYRFLAVLRKFSTKDPYLTGMESLLDHGDLNSSERILLNFSLGKAYEDLKQYETAFTYIAEGNRLKRNCFFYDRTNNEKLFSKIKKEFNRSVVQQFSHSGLDDPTPIFILGMPRSGTSLVEQILASHPDVYGAGELTTLDQVITTYGRTRIKRPYPEFISQLTDRDCREMGSAYVKKVRNESGRQAYITDKMPHNFLFVGMIAMILPQARIIHCVRDPMDTCLSMFKNHFSRLHAYAYDLCELGHYYRLYRDLMGHWHQITPGSVYDIHYEKLVSEPRKQIKQLLSFCRLTWNDQCLNFHRSNRPVLTASTSQVHRALYSDSVGLWEKYKKHLKPLMEEILAG